MGINAGSQAWGPRKIPAGGVFNTPPVTPLYRHKAAKNPMCNEDSENFGFLNSIELFNQKNAKHANSCLAVIWEKTFGHARGPNLFPHRTQDPPEE